MAPFDIAALTDGGQDLAFQLFANSSISLFHKPDVLQHSIEWLIEHGYVVIELDSAEWKNHEKFHASFAAALNFPDYYGHNLDALNDCLSDVAVFEYGSSPESSGLVVVIRHFDAFARRFPETAQALLDIYATQSRHALLFGHRMMCLVQSDDPEIQLPLIGGQPVIWNRDEWLRSNR